MTSLGKAGLVGFEVLICFLQWAAFWHLDSGLVKVGSGYFIGIFFLLLASASFPHLEAGLPALEGGPDRRCRHVLTKKGARGQDLTRVGLAHHDCLYFCRLKYRSDQVRGTN